MFFSFFKQAFKKSYKYKTLLPQAEDKVASSHFLLKQPPYVQTRTAHPLLHGLHPLLPSLALVHAPRVLHVQQDRLVGLELRAALALELVGRLLGPATSRGCRRTTRKQWAARWCENRHTRRYFSVPLAVLRSPHIASVRAADRHTGYIRAGSRQAGPPH